jgi:hypothetical protein
VLIWWSLAAAARRAPRGPSEAQRGADAGPAAPHSGAVLFQIGPNSAVQRPDRLSCRTMASRSAAAAASAHYARLGPWTLARRPRGTVRGTTCRIIPAQRVPSAQLSVLSVQPARSVHGAVLLVNGRSAVRIRSPALGGLHISVGPIFTFASDILAGTGCGRVVCTGFLVVTFRVGRLGYGHAAAGRPGGRGRCRAWSGRAVVPRWPRRARGALRSGWRVSCGPGAGFSAAGP